MVIRANELESGKFPLFGFINLSRKFIKGAVFKGECPDLHVLLQPTVGQAITIMRIATEMLPFKISVGGICMPGSVVLMTV